MRDHVKKIIDGLISGKFEQYGEHPDFQDEIDTIAEIIEDPARGEDVLMAALDFWEESSASLSVWEFPDNLAEHYRGNHPSPGKFARQEAEETADGDKATFLSEYGDWIDWDELAESADFSDYSFIELPGHFGVYVFRD